MALSFLLACTCIVFFFCCRTSTASAAESSARSAIQLFMVPQVFDSMPAALCVVHNSSQRFIAANSAFEQVIGPIPSTDTALNAIFYANSELTRFTTSLNNKRPMPQGYTLYLPKQKQGSFTARILQIKEDYSLCSFNQNSIRPNTSADLFHSAIREILPDILFFIDSQGRLVNGNDAFEASLHAAMNKLHCSSCDDFFSSAYIARYGQAVATAREKHQPICLQEEYVFPDGSIANYETTYIPYFSTRNEYLGTLGVSKNSTEKPKVLEKSTQQIRLLDATNKAVECLLAREGSFDANLWNAMRVLGTAAGVDRVYVWKNHKDTEGTLHGSQIAEWSNGGSTAPSAPFVSTFCYKELTPNLLQRLSAGKTVSSLVKNLPEREQKLFLDQSIKSVLLSPIMLNGKFWGFIGFDDRTTERLWSAGEENTLRAAGTLIGTALFLLQTTQDLEQAKTRFKDISIAAGEVICELDINDTVIYISERCSEVFGLPPDQIIGRPYADIVGSQEFYWNFTQQIQSQTEEQGFFRGIEHSIVDAQGKLHHLSSSGLPYYDEKRQLQGLRMTSVDVTRENEGKKMLRDALAAVSHANEELEQYAKVTQDLAFQADVANRTKGEFLANIGHEVRTPINIISGMAYLILRTDLTDKQRECLEKISDASASLLKIMNNIIDFAQVKGNKLHISEYPLRFADVVSSALSGYKADCERKKLAFNLFIDPAIPALLQGDAARIGQVFKNLVHNAIKFTSEGSIQVTCKLKHETSFQASIACTVSDTGIGIPHEKQATLFELFSQADGSSTRRYAGTGVGLALTQRLVEAMQGVISVESAPGEGTTFSFNLVLKKLAGNSLALHTSGNVLPESFIDDPLADIKGSSILVLLDNSCAQQQMILDVLDSMGISTTIASTQQTALTLLDSSPFTPPFDLIFIILSAENQSLGLEVAQEARSRPALAKLPIITYSCGSKLDSRFVDKKDKLYGWINSSDSIPVLQRHLADWLRLSHKLHQADLQDRVATMSALQMNNAHPHTKQGHTLSPDLKQHLNQLEELLTDDDAASNVLMTELRPAIINIDPELGKKIADAISVFDFADALETLHTFRAKYDEQ